MGCSQSVPVAEPPSSAAARQTSSTTQPKAPASGGSTASNSSPGSRNYAEHVLNNNKDDNAAKKSGTAAAGTVAGRGGGGGKPPMAPSTSTTTVSNSSSNNENNNGNAAAAGKSAAAATALADSNRGRFESYASGASTPDVSSRNNTSSSDDDEDDNRSFGSSFSHRSSQSDKSSTTDKETSASRRSSANGSTTSGRPKILVKSTSAVGLDEMIEERREAGDLRQNVVHFEVPFGKPIEEVYDGVHNGPVLGSGISGLVRLVTHKATGLKYAVKVLDLGLVDTKEGLKQLREEIFIMCQLDHPNIVRLEEVYESHSEIYLVQELCLGGELFDRLDEQPDYHYTEAECARLIKQMLSAVRYLHHKGIIHRDLKLENFLFSSTSTDSELKMIDFGLSKHFRYGEIQHEAVGTPYTVAPEVIRGSYDERCDLWAIGVISFLLLSGEPPFGGCGGPEPLMTVRSNILKGQFAFEPEDIWDLVSMSAREFIKCLLVIDPKSRPTAREAQKHKWMQEWASRSRKVHDNVLNPNVVKALVNFKEFSDMRKLLCEVLSFTLLPDQIKELRREFEKMDTDGSGEISLAALKQVLMTNAGAGSLGALTEEEVEDIFNAMRVRKTETRIHWHEFIAAGLSQCQVDDRNLRLAFDRLDSDHKGYITLDDIMDLMGSDALQSEEAMRRMWGDSIKAVSCQHARITYDDFLLLMKGQTRDVPAPSQELDQQLEASTSNLQVVLASTPLHVVQESPEGGEGSPARASPEEKMVTRPPGSGEGLLNLAPKMQIPGLVGGAMASESAIARSDVGQMPPIPTSPFVFGASHSAPSTPADHKLILEVEEGEETPPLGIQTKDVNEILTAGPGIPGSSASLTPPQSPVRGPRDYVTPLGADRFCVSLSPANANNIMVPGLPLVPEKPSPYTRRRSKSVDDTATENSSGSETKDQRDFHNLADAVRDMIVPETGNFHYGGLDDVVKDENKSALVVNRQLYRAHRHMRLAVVEASKRLEEQQARHARDILLSAQKEKEDNSGAGNMGMIQAGLVMRHGHKNQVSSEAIRKLLHDNEAQQQVLVEKASKRGGRGRRSRKKTISDMSGMLNSMGSEDMGQIASKAALAEQEQERANSSPSIKEYKSFGELPASGSESSQSAAFAAAAAVAAAEVATTPSSSVPELPGLEPPQTNVGQTRDATVPGEFHKTVDPFGRKGKYGATVAALDSLGMAVAAHHNQNNNNDK